MKIGHLFKMISNQLDAGLNEKLRMDGLTGVQLDVLMFLDPRRNMITSQKDIGKEFGIKHTTTIDILKRLEDKKFIYRQVNKDNAKFRDVYLTEKGRQKVMDVNNKRILIDKMMVDGISDEEQAELQRLLIKVYENIKKGGNCNE